ncbi:MAG: RHS domain-containing protein, partial [bacterium]|nr:RHS domain-containing protein [bacterium]
MTDSGVPAQANVYVFTSGGSYMGLYAATDANGEVSFLLPADGGNSTNYNGYKFRADYSGTQTWSDPLLVTADINNPLSMEAGGSARRLIPNSSSPLRGEDRGGGEEVQVASLYMLPGLLAQAANSALADSNGEHLYYYHSDHLGTPLFLTNTDGVVVWRGEYLPFGEVFSEDKDPDG